MDPYDYLSVFLATLDPVPFANLDHQAAEDLLGSVVMRFLEPWCLDNNNYMRAWDACMDSGMKQLNK